MGSARGVGVPGRPEVSHGARGTWSVDGREFRDRLDGPGVPQGRANRPSGGRGRYMSVQRVGIVVHGGRPRALAAADVVRRWCERRDVGCVAIDVWSQDEQRRDAREEVDAAGSPDLIVTLGGDGTFLRGARLAAQNDALVLGVDLGTLGFLTEVPADDVECALYTIQRGQVNVETRLMLTMRASCPLQLPEGMEALLRYGR